METGDKMAESKNGEGCRNYFPERLRPRVVERWKGNACGEEYGEINDAESTNEDSIDFLENDQVLRKTIPLPGVGVKLIYRSQDAPGYLSLLTVLMQDNEQVSGLSFVHLKIYIEGQAFEKMFETELNLKYDFSWDRRNAYNQKVHGIAVAMISVGYEFEGCNKIYWKKLSGILQGYDLPASEIGSWNLDVHHSYNFQEGILHMGNGSTVYFKNRKKKIRTLIGDGKPRRPDCHGGICEGQIGVGDAGRVLFPHSLALGLDGSLLVGDFDALRKIEVDKETIKTVFQMRGSDVNQRYHVAVNKLNGEVFLTQGSVHMVVKVKSLNGVVNGEPQNNWVRVAGSGEPCSSTDMDDCGDGGLALEAKLFYPKGIAIDKDGLIYIADGSSIRYLDAKNIIRSLIGSRHFEVAWTSLPCQSEFFGVNEAMLQWPTSLAINPLDESLYILDNSVIYQVVGEDVVRKVVGVPYNCPHTKDLNESSQLVQPQDFAFDQDGNLYVLESAGKSVARIRVLTTNDTLQHVAGTPCTACTSLPNNHVTFIKPVSIATSPDGSIYVGDAGDFRIKVITSELPAPDKQGHYEILCGDRNFVFNRVGQHISTFEAGGGGGGSVGTRPLYTFSYLNAYYGKLEKVVDNKSGNVLTIQRDYKEQAKELVTSDGRSTKFQMDSAGNLQSLARYTGNASKSTTVKFAYLNSSGPLSSGLLSSFIDSRIKMESSWFYSSDKRKTSCRLQTLLEAVEELQKNSLHGDVIILPPDAGDQNIDSDIEQTESNLLNEEHLHEPAGEVELEMIVSESVSDSDHEDNKKV